MKTTAQLYSISLLAIMTACNGQVKKEEKETLAKQPNTIVKTAIGDLTLPPPYATESKTNNSKVIGWPEGKTPTAPEGFTVTKFADGFENPRWTYIAPNNDIFVVESGTRTSKNQIIILRDKDKDGKFETREVFLKDLNRPFGMLVLKDFFYVANTDGLYRYPYKNAPLKLEAKGTKILELPAGGYNNHWTRNIIVNPEGTKIYVSVGSGSNVGENGMDKEVRRADILEINPDGTGEKIYAAGLRNPVGMDWNPINKELWTAVNERDELGDDLVPDYITSVKRDGFYGWPYSYYGNNPDPRMKGERKDLAAKAIVPDVPVGAHTASLGLAFYNKTAFPENTETGLSLVSTDPGIALRSLGTK
ncbi:Glucose/arabinose dehydrogenase, beta-propeller fold [Flavobacterium frigidimaris]|nr:Glucose/arabinose dehydrogenase, beta-propeller fold [Flavobacterium frigidimaris]